LKIRAERQFFGRTLVISNCKRIYQWFRPLYLITDRWADGHTVLTKFSLLCKNHLKMTNNFRPIAASSSIAVHRPQMSRVHKFCDAVNKCDVWTGGCSHCTALFKKQNAIFYPYLFFLGGGHLYRCSRKTVLLQLIKPLGYKNEMSNTPSTMGTRVRHHQLVT
jgi:hypothetical protein